MKTGYAIIGAGFGDEGKGLMTDYFARKLIRDGQFPVNVRFNGGAQAGHTVVDGNKRHIFGHIGAGSFAGIPTFLSSKFIVNPFSFYNERKALSELHILPSVEVHPLCQITTIFDVVINRLQELSRGDNKHGSCGLGINETLTRAKAGFSLTVNEVVRAVRARTLDDILNNIYFNWWKPRIENLKDIPPEGQEWLNLAIIENEIENIRHVPNIFSKITAIPADSDTYIFEGAQGLGLDKSLGIFPFVTPSVTGLPGVLMAAAEIGVTEIFPIYVTRAYKTRHGAGPLDYENEKITNKELVDETNVHGQWQGHLRYAPLCIVELCSYIERDLERSWDMAYMMGIKINKPKLAVTCLDQIGNEVSYYSILNDYCHRTTNADQFIKDLDKLVKPVQYISYGPTANHVTER